MAKMMVGSILRCFYFSISVQSSFKSRMEYGAFPPPFSPLNVDFFFFFGGGYYRPLCNYCNTLPVYMGALFSLLFNKFLLIYIYIYI